MQANNLDSNITIMPFTSLWHDEIIRLQNEHKLNIVVSIHELPELGIVATHGKELIAMGFLRLIEGSYGMVEGYISNPSIPGELRNKALNSITIELIGMAKSLKLKKILAFTTNESIKVRAESLGFVSDQSIILTLDV